MSPVCFHGCCFHKSPKSDPDMNSSHPSSSAILFIGFMSPPFNAAYVVPSSPFQSQSTAHVTISSTGERAHLPSAKCPSIIKSLGGTTLTRFHFSHLGCCNQHYLQLFTCLSRYNSRTKKKERKKTKLKKTPSRLFQRVRGSQT